MKTITQKAGTAISDGSYRKTGTGTMVFRYKVTGSKDELDAYRKAQGDFLREDDEKNPLWFSVNNIGKSAKLLISSKGKVFADTSEIDGIAAMVKQYGGNFGQALASEAAARIFGGKTVTTPQDNVVDSNADLSQA